MLKFKQLPNWVLTNPKPGFYDTESLTVIEQTAKLYKTIQDLINSYNEFTTNIENGCNDFETEINKAQTDFINQVNEIVHDYIAMIDEKIIQQDLVIAEAVNYFKNNINDTLSDAITEIINSGEIDQIILDAIKEVNDLLNPRVTNLENSVIDIVDRLNDLDDKTDLTNGEVDTLKTQMTGVLENLDVLNEDSTNIHSDINNLTTNLGSTYAQAGESEFKGTIGLMSEVLDLDIVGIEYFDKSSSIDQSLFDGIEVVSNYLDTNKREIVIPSETSKIIVLPKIDLINVVKEIYVKCDKYDSGSINIFVSTDNGVNYTPVNDSELTEYSGAGLSLRIKLELIGSVTLKNIGFGIRN